MEEEPIGPREVVLVTEAASPIGEVRYALEHYLSASSVRLTLPS